MKLKRFLSDTLSFGSGSVKIPASEMIESFKTRYDEMIKRGLKFKLSFHRVNPGGAVVVHTKVPSETVEGFYYDVLIELVSNGAKDFEECDIKIFSNCPSFVYTYAYVFYHLDDDEAPTKQKGLIIDEYHKKIPKDNLMLSITSKKLSEEILHGRPIVRNPYGLPLFDKSIYFAIFNMLDRTDFNQVINNKRATSQKALFDSIPSFETLMTKRKDLDQKNKERSRRDKTEIEKQFKKVERKLNTLNRGESTKVVERLRGTTSNTSSSVNKVSGKTNKIKPLKRASRS